jgi:hypothetical protein
MLFKIFQAIFLILFAAAVLLAWRKVWKRRHTSANGWMLPFAHFSFAAWILWVSQYGILVANQFGFFTIDSCRSTGLLLAVMENALWAAAILSLHSKLFSRVSLTVPLLVMIAIVFALVTYQTRILTRQPVTYLGAISAAIMFLVLSISIWQLRLSKIYVLYFFLHGYFQWWWKSVWLTPFIDLSMMILVLPMWHLALLYIWNKLIIEMLGRFRVMISSTIKDLREERAAAERAIASLNLEGLRSETIGSRPYTPIALCRLWAEQCNAFILITGQRYGHRIKPAGQSVCEFEFEVAHGRDPDKILVYVKDGVTREPELQRFVDRLQAFETGYVNSSFDTATDLEPQIRRDLQAWLAAHPQDDDGPEGWY